MRHLALIVSKNMKRLKTLSDSAQKAGFSVNCANDTKQASTLVVRYSDDYHVIVLDQNATGKETDNFIKGTRGNAPKSRVLLVTQGDPDIEFSDIMVTVASEESAGNLLPRLKREVTRYRSNPLGNINAG